jgi:probable rRNA maturation factor
VLRVVMEAEDARWRDALPQAQELLTRAIGLALAGVAAPAGGIEVGVRLVDDGTIRGLNRDWRGRDAPTNVLSFPLGDPGPVDDPDIPWLIGDIVISFDTVAGESRRDGKPFAHHVTHLAIHAALHLIGHDHEDDREADAMEAKEAALLAGLGIPDPYAAGPDRLGPASTDAA